MFLKKTPYKSISPIVAAAAAAAEAAAAAKAAELERQEKEGAAAREAYETCMMTENELRAVGIAIDRAAREAEEERSRAIKKAAMEKKKNMGKRKPAARRRPGRR